jgi:Protein of unknown function (DUF3987)
MTIDKDTVISLRARLNARKQQKQAQAAWPVMADAAYHGIAGDFVRLVSPQSEADPVGLLLQFLTLFGNVVGREPYWSVESDRHGANLFSVLVGTSSKGRKGTSLGRVRAVIRGADETWAGDRIKGGLSSGEGLINEVRDPRLEYDKKEKRLEIVDPGMTDKRLMVVEPEFAGLLAVADRHGNTISPLIRRAWDGDKLQTITKNSPLCATGAHISIIGHITEDELRARITRTDMANGFANRFLFALVKRSKELEFGGANIDSEITDLGMALRDYVERAKTVGRVGMTTAARGVWKAVYSALTADQPGLLGAITARSDPQARRLAMLYALLDGKGEVDEPHLQAALAVWEYCEASAIHIFGRSLGDCCRRYCPRPQTGWAGRHEPNGNPRPLWPQPVCRPDRNRIRATHHAGPGAHGSPLDWWSAIRDMVCDWGVTHHGEISGPSSQGSRGSANKDGADLRPKRRRPFVVFGRDFGRG